ncbi:MAG: hypothetical protein DPW09_03360 [Anaerolineae bacterium]|nr:hypothetical protein [Anaerolineales bacterium]MCQ3972469.1 hypothetical protein [Anaerolineae bacterium]
MADYILRNIRTLLTEGFSDRELRRFCYDTPEFRPAYDELADLTGKAAIIDALLEYADRSLLLDRVLAWAKAAKPARYELHQPYGLSSEPAARLGKLHYVPELPPHFLPRPDDLASVKAALLAGDKSIAITGATRKVGLQGMGGIGKSVLAAALAYDDEVRQAFPDGIFWLTLGQEPNLTTRQAQLAESLGDPIRIFGDAQQGRARLSELLAERTCLLILDDVWQTAHAEAFNALGPQGRLLLTSRDAALIRAMGAAEHRLGVLSQAQALELLAQWAAQPVETLPPEAKTTAKACGYLPLALAMLGAQVRGKPDRWANVLHKLQTADLAKIRQAFPHYPYPNLLLALQVSVEALEPELQARYLELAVFPEDTSIPEAAAQTLWAGAGLDEYDIQDALDTLVDRSLARRDDRGRLSLHDLQYDYVRSWQPGDVTALHERLVAAYRQQCTDGWASGPDDGYFFDHLAYHLAEAGQREALYALISKEWMDAQFKRTFSHRAFADDVERAIAVAGAEEPLNLVQVIRNCLIYATLGELATSVPPEILGVLAQVGQVEAALGYASLMQEAEKKIKGNCLIGQTLLSRGDLVAARRVYIQTLEIVVGIKDDVLKANTLCNIAPSLVQVGVVDQALQAAAEIEDEEQKTRVLNWIATALVQVGVVNQALQMAAGIEDEEQKARVLNWIATALAETGAVDQALQMAVEIEDEEQKAGALSGVASALAKTGAIDQALQVAVEIEDEEQKAGALSGIARALAQMGAVDQALHLIAKIEDEEQKAVTLRDIAWELARAGAVEQALKVAHEIEVEWYKAEALMKGITGALARTGAVDQALQVADGIKNERQKVWALRSITLALARTGAVDQALQVVAGIEKEMDKALMLEGIVHILARAGAVEQALKVADEIEVELHKAGALGDIAQALVHVGAVEQALKVTDEIEDEGHKAWALRDIVQALAQAGVVEQALKVADKIEDEGHKARALRDIAQVLVQAGSVEQALKIMAAGFEDEGYKMEALKSIAETLAQTGMAEQALQVATKIEIGAERQKPEEAWALEGWAAWFEAEMQKKAALRDITQALAQAGRTTEAYPIWRDFFISTFLSRKRAFTILQHSAPALAALDQGETLWQVYQAVMEVEGWWSERRKDEG